MKIMSTGKRVGWTLVAVVGTVGLCGWTSSAASLEDSQQTAKTIVTKAKEIATVQVERAKTAQAVEKGKGPGSELAHLSNLLQGISSEAKLEFLDSLMLVDGKVASFKIDLLKRDLGEARLKVFLAALTPNPQPGYKTVAAGYALGLCTNGVCEDSACRPSGDHNACLDKPKYLCFDSCR